MGQTIGYSFLRDHWRLPVFPITQPARTAPVTRVTPEPDGLLVPIGVAPKSESPLDHVLFALKYEGVNLPILLGAMPHISADSLQDALCGKPNSAYLRITAYLWEHATGHRLTDVPEITAPTVPLFDPERYITSCVSQKDSRWRIAFNGLGGLDYCVTVRRTEAIQHLLEEDILGQVRSFFENTDQRIVDRAVAWAYLSETEGSFAIERESVPYDKAQAFADLLQKAFDPDVCDETYLTGLQNAVITNPFDRAAGYRGTQNWLQNGLRGAASVSYIPPSPELLDEMMPHITRMADTLHTKVDPLVAASVVSFAFVYAHPFMDGNGRLSRFLFHRTLAQSGQMESPTVGRILLPVSVAMKRYEQRYLQSLQSFSVPARNLWDVHWIDEDRFEFTMRGDGTAYRYWDATDQVRFGLEMAKSALQEDLRSEVDALRCYDAVYAQVDAHHDVRNKDLSVLIRSCMENAGSVSKNRRKQYAAMVPEKAFDAIEDAWASFMADRDAVIGDSQEDALPNEAAAEADKAARENGQDDICGRRDA